MSDQQRILEDSCKDWEKANHVIIVALREWFPTLPHERAEAFAAAIQARLAHADLVVARFGRITCEGR